MRRPRARLVTLLPGGLGTRSGGTRTAPQGACWTGTVPLVSGRSKARQADEANWRRGPDKETGTETRKRGPGEQKSPPWSAERRPHPSQEDAADGRLVRRLALHSLGIRGEKRKAGVPRAAKNRGGGALACRAEAQAKAGCLKIELGMKAAHRILRYARAKGAKRRLCT